MCLTRATTQSCRVRRTKEGAPVVGSAVGLRLDLQHLRYVGHVALSLPILLRDRVGHLVACDVFVPQ